MISLHHADMRGSAFDALNLEGTRFHNVNLDRITLHVALADDADLQSVSPAAHQ